MNVFCSFQEMEHVDFEMFGLLSEAAIGIFILSLYCYFGKVATDSFGLMAYALYECNWYELPLNLQKYFILMIQNAQKPIFYTGSGLAILDMETFTKVSHIWKETNKKNAYIFF